MDLRQLRYFVAVADASSFGRASTVLGVAQSALSTQVARLESEMGVELFVRSPRVCKLTPPGRVVLGEARKTLFQADLTMEVARRAARGEIGGLQLGYARALPWHLPGRVVTAFTGMDSNATIDLRELSTQQQIAALGTAEIDAGIAIGPIEDNTVDTKLIAREALFIACGPTHRFAKRSGVTLGDLQDEQVYILSNTFSHEITSLLSTLFRSAGFMPRVSYEADEIRVLWGLVTGGRGVTFGYRSFSAANIPGLVFLPILDSTLRFDFFLLWRKGSRDSLLGNLIGAVPLWQDET